LLIMLEARRQSAEDRRAAEEEASRSAAGARVSPTGIAENNKAYKDETDKQDTESARSAK
jgi:hypothetical protein